MSFFTGENGYFDDDQIEFRRPGGGRTSIIDWDNIIESGKWFFLPNSLRTERAVEKNGTPKPPQRILCEGYKFSMRQAPNPSTGEEGLMIKCTLYPDNM